MEDGGLTELHLIASRLRIGDLETYIRAHPEELEKKGAVGYCPLWYASTCGELANIRTLLKYGAILNGDTFDFPYFFSIFGRKAFDFLDEHVSSSALKSIFKEGCAREWFVESDAMQLDIDETLAVDRLCLEHGFDPNHKAHEAGQTTLMDMLEWSYSGIHLRVKQLLDHGADLELTGFHGKTALHQCIEVYRYSDISLKVFTVLLEKGPQLDYRTWDGTTMLHALILYIAYLEPIETILHSDISGLPLDAKDSDGYTAFDLLILRARLLRQDLGDCSVSLEVSQSYEYFPWYNAVIILEKLMRRAKKPDMERKILTAFETLLHKVQEVQGIPPEEQYSSVESVLDQEDKDAEALRLEGLPGSWPE